MLRVLIVEDDLMLADFAEETLVEHGYEVSGIARSVSEAIALARQGAHVVAVGRDHARGAAVVVWGFGRTL